MKATKKVCSLIPIMFITISELKIQKVVVDNKEVTIETQDKTAQFLTPLNEKLDIPEPTTSNQDAKEKDIAEEIDISQPVSAVVHKKTLCHQLLAPHQPPECNNSALH